VPLPGSLTVPPPLETPPEDDPPEPEPPPDELELTCCRQEAVAARAAICVRLQVENWLLRLIFGAIR
jgi:hypothetical protein